MPPARERITADERRSSTSVVTVTTTQKRGCRVDLIRCRRARGGHFILIDGTRVFYEYKGDNPEGFRGLFAYRPMRMRCVAHLDENLKVNKLEIFEVERIQGNLFHEAPS
jgi:hypothetical protein